jgi:succinate-semialdehyde dehydrogenase/glutarate-semialdehyde dehydrogenase
MRIQSTNPFTNTLLEEFETFSSEKVATLVEQAERTFSSWRRTDFAHRCRLMKKAASIMRDKKATYARTITLEMGKPIRESVSEVEKCAWTCEFYAENAEKFLRDIVIETDADKSYVIHQPLGAILAIMPWNFPFWQVVRFAAPALMAGNVGLLKHASNVTRCALHIEDIFQEAGFPEGVFQSLILESGKITSLIENPVIKAVTLTGSEKAGAEVAAAAGKNIKKSVLELGGSNAFVVLDDADIEQAATVGVQARMINTGQSCIAAKRFIIMEKVADKFLEAFRKKLGALRAGDPLESTTEIGTLARIDLAEQLESQVNKSIAMGAKLLMGGNRDQAKYTPAILTGVKPGMPAFDEELFGPVAPFTVVKTEDEALAMANHTKFGLGTTICTTNRLKAEKFIENIEDGSVFINALVKSDPHLPFGGTKRSGYGRELSEYGIKEFVNIKTVYIKETHDGETVLTE